MTRTLLLLGVSLSLAGAAQAQNVATSSSTGDNNSVAITQTGQNTATVTQTEDDNGAVVTQSGSLNTATVTQANSPTDPTNASDGNRATTLQNGTGNASTIQQGFDGSPYSVDGDATVEQIGTMNQSSVQQASGFYNEVTVYQDGSDNQSTVTQGGTSNATPLHFSGEAGVSQVGDRNVSTLLQQPQGNHAAIVQGRLNFRSDDNRADVAQNGVNQRVELLQYGTFNETVITQNGQGNTVFARSSGDRNMTSFDQDGRNYASHDIFGDDNTFDVVQNGQNNRATVNTTVHSDRNDIDFRQLGDGNTIQGGTNRMIDGSDNTVLVLQGQTSGLGGHTATVSVLGNNNTSSITQN